MPAPFTQGPLPFPAASHFSLPKPFHSQSSEPKSFPCKSDRHLTCSIQRFQMPQGPAAALRKPEPRALSNCGSRNVPPLWGQVPAKPGMDRKPAQARAHFHLGRAAEEAFLTTTHCSRVSRASRIQATLLLVIPNGLGHW